MLDQNPRITSELVDLRSTRQANRTFSFADLVRFLRLRRVSIAIPILLFTALAYGYNLVALPMYSARAQIIIDPRLPQFIPGHNEETVLAWDSAQVESEIAVLLSERIAGEVVTKLGLDRDKDFRSPMPMAGRVQALFGLSAAPPQEVKPDRFRDALALIQNGLSVRRTGLSYAIDITFSYPDAFRTSEIANALAEAYITDQIDNRSQAARLGGEWLQGRMVFLRSQMNAASQAVQIFRASHNYSIAKQAATPLSPTDAKGQDRSNPGAPIPPEATTLEELEASASTYRKIYESFLQSYTESVQRQSFPVSDARILTPASEPKTRSAPRATLIYALAGLLGTLIGLGIAILLHHVDRKIRSTWQITALCTLDDLGRIPRLRRGFFRSGLSRLRTLGRPRSHVLTTARGIIERGINGRRWTGRGRSIHFVAALASPSSPFSRAVTSIRTLVSLSGRQAPLRCLGISAAHRGAGSSALASNLASLIASRGTRTLLIDTDDARRTLTRRVGFDGGPGLQHVLADVATLDEAIVRFHGTKLDFLPASGPSPFAICDEPASKLDVLLEHLSARYDLVVLDLAPLWPIGEALEYCAVLDGVVLVVEWGKTKADAVIASAECLARVQARTLGFVLNKAET